MLGLDAQRNHPEALHVRGLGQGHVPDRLERVPPRGAVEVLEYGIPVGKSENESRRFPVHESESEEFRFDERLEFVGQGPNFPVVHRNEAPVLFPCGVVDFLNRPDLAVEVLHIGATGDETGIPAPGPFGQFLQSIETAIPDRGNEGQQVLGLGVSGPLDQGRIEGRVVGHHDDGGSVEPVDQKPALVVGRRAERARNDEGAAAGSPALDRPQQGLADVGVVDTFEETEMNFAGFVELVEPMIENRRDPPDRPPTLPCDE